MAAFGALAAGDLANFAVAATPGGIEAQEKAGQLEQAARETLPKNLGAHRAAFEALGFVFGKPVDEIFIEAQFPAGWSKKPTDHSMWSEIVDDKGRRRGMIFYKAAFYDRHAHASLVRRFEVSQTFDDPKRAMVVLRDGCGLVKYEIGPFARPSADENPRQAWAKLEEARTQIEAWLALEFPNHSDPLAYWDDTDAHGKPA